MNLALIAAIVVVGQTSPREPRLSLFAGAGYLAAAPGNGIAVEGGLQLRADEHLVASFDLGYGVLGAQAAQDRWWLLPSLAFTFAVRTVRVDLGAGVGLGASSGYASWATYARAPFTPDWSFQLTPEARVHATVSLPVSSNARLFARAEAASLFLANDSIGARTGGAEASFANTTWLHVVIGAQLGIL